MENTSPLKQTLSTTGEVDDIAIGGNLQFESVADPVNKNANMAIGDNGFIQLQPPIMPANATYTATNGTDINVGATVTVIIPELEVTDNIEAGRGSYSFSCVINNNTGVSGYFRIALRAMDDTIIREVTVHMLALETHKQILFSGIIASAISAGTKYKVDAYAQDIAVTVNGVNQLTRFVIENHLEATSLEEVAEAYGIKANKYMKSKVVTTAMSPYSVDADEDYILVCVPGTGDIEVVLPSYASMAGRDPQKLIIVNNATNYGTKVVCSSGDTYRYGNSEFVLPKNMGSAEFILHEYGHINNDSYEALNVLGYYNMPASAFGTLASVPVVSEINTQPEFYTLDGSVVTVAVSGLYSIGVSYRIDSSIGSDWETHVKLYINDVEVKDVLINGLAGKDAIAGLEDVYALDADDEIEIKAEHTGLTGQIEYVKLNINTKI